MAKVREIWGGLAWSETTSQTARASRIRQASGSEAFISRGITFLFGKSAFELRRVMVTGEIDEGSRRSKHGKRNHCQSRSQIWGHF